MKYSIFSRRQLLDNFKSYIVTKLKTFLLRNLLLGRPLSCSNNLQVYFIYLFIVSSTNFVLDVCNWVLLQLYPLLSSTHSIRTILWRSSLIYRPKQLLECIRQTGNPLVPKINSCWWAPHVSTTEWDPFCCAVRNRQMLRKRRLPPISRCTETSQRWNRTTFSGERGPAEPKTTFG